MKILFVILLAGNHISKSTSGVNYIKKDQLVDITGWSLFAIWGGVYYT